MPNRIIKESINESRGLSDCSFFAQDLFKRLITYADDYGRFNADPQIMIARLYPRELDVVTKEDLTDGLVELVGIGKIGFYTSSARHEVYGAFPNWGDHQRVRESKKNCPDPTDTSVNDWYYRRHIPMDMKVALLQRDNLSCVECGKRIAETDNARLIAKMGTGLFHVDHVVPCNQGGRATLENLRILCPKCNLSRKRFFSYDEILKFADNCGTSPQLAATFRNSPPESNPIQSESISESESVSLIGDGDAHKFQTEQNRVLDAAEDAGFQRGNTVRARLISLYADNGLGKMLNAINECVRHGACNLAYLEAVLKGAPKQAKASVNAQAYEQRDYADVIADLERKQNERILKRLSEAKEVNSG